MSWRNKTEAERSKTTTKIDRRDRKDRARGKVSQVLGGATINTTTTTTTMTKQQYHQQQTTSNKQQATSNKQQTTNTKKQKNRTEQQQQQQQQQGGGGGKGSGKKEEKRGNTHSIEFFMTSISTLASNGQCTSNAFSKPVVGSNT